MLVFQLIICSGVLADDRVYTNEDLEKYNQRYSPPEVKEKPIVDYPMLRGSVSVMKNEVRPILDKQIRLRLEGCPTLQDGIDRRLRGKGKIEFDMNTKGRTLEEICTTVGAGCRVCEKVK